VLVKRTSASDQLFFSGLQKNTPFWRFAPSICIHRENPPGKGTSATLVDSPLAIEPN